MGIGDCSTWEGEGRSELDFKRGGGSVMGFRW